MKKIAFAMIMMVLLLSLVLVGCTRSASKGPNDIATSTSEIPFPVNPNPNRITEIIGITQTAAVQEGGEQPAEGGSEATQAPVQDTAVPTPTQVVVVVSTPTPGTPSTYTVQEGEFPYCLARRFNVNPADLLAINNIGDYVAPGTTITIPKNSTWPSDFPRSLKNHPTAYTVQSGDTIYSIACTFGDVDPNQIIEANKLESPYNLTAGTTLQIP